jgi:phage terminase large subunit-like protein
MKRSSPARLQQQLRQNIRDAYTHAERASATGALPYLQHVVIDSRPEPRPFRERAEPWQWALVNRFAPAIEHVAQLKTDYDGVKNFWVELPKGHDKSSLVGRMVNWALAFARGPWKGYVYAKDKEQAGYLAEAMHVEARLNPWLLKRLTFRNWDVTGKDGANVTIMAADAAGAQGQRPDLLVVDEIVHWPDHQGEALFNNLVTGLRKRPCVFFVISNAGTLHTWQHKASETAKVSPRWYHYHAPHRLAGWMDEAAVEEDRKLLPPAFAARLYDNLWCDPGVDAGFVTRDEANKCVDPGLAINDQGLAGRSYYAAVDYGPTKDRTVAVVLHSEEGQLILDRMDVWMGSREQPVKIEAVERWLTDTREKFRLESVVIDPYQLESTYQRYNGLVPLVKWNARGGQTNHEMAQNLRSLIVNRRIAWPAGCGEIFASGARRPHSFVDELAELVVKTMGYGWRMDHLPGRHDDRAVAVAMAALQATKAEPKKKLYSGDLWW